MRRHNGPTFIIVGRQTNAPMWDGRVPMDRNLYADQIKAIRQLGGDVIAKVINAGQVLIVIVIVIIIPILL